MLTTAICAVTVVRFETGCQLGSLISTTTCDGLSADCVRLEQVSHRCELGLLFRRALVLKSRLVLSDPGRRTNQISS